MAVYILFFFPVWAHPGRAPNSIPGHFGQVRYEAGAVADQTEAEPDWANRPANSVA